MDTNLDPKQLPAEQSETTEVVSRDNLGRFVAGVSGNPQGRQKGSKNRTTLMKQAMEEALTRELSNDFLEILGQALQMAKEGDKDMIKMVLGDFLKEARRAPQEEADDFDLRNLEVNITQYFGTDEDQKLARKVASSAAIDAEFEEIKKATGLTKGKQE